jgi:putative tricarboxylic transport membrane protein
LNRGEVVSGVVLAALGVYIVTEAARWEYLGPDGPGPGFFPLWYGIAMVALAALLVVQNFMAKPAEAEGAPANWREIGRALMTWGGFVVSVALLKLLGFILSFALFTFFVVAGLYRRSLVIAASTAAGCAAGFYLVFPFALNVRLPVGFLGF